MLVEDVEVRTQIDQMLDLISSTRCASLMDRILI